VEHAIQVFAGISFLAIGLSHLLQPLAWVEWFSKLRSLGRPGAFAEGLAILNFGALIVAFHNAWSGPGVVLTVIGWAHVLKGLVRFLAPTAILGIYDRMVPERAWQFRVAGGGAIVLGVFFLWLAGRNHAA
jgi:uncharacterized protein YjeT (DUF2065 family)